MARALGIDVGERRIGLAVSDPSGTVATPLRVLQVKTPDSAVREIIACVQEYQVDRLVVGLPMRLDGSIGPAAEKTGAFADRLKKATPVPVVLWDERFSTVTAQQALIEGGTRRNKRKHVVDKLAAQILLQHYLDAQAGLPPPDEESL
jgi:putative holliday junction resolvase